MSRSLVFVVPLVLVISGCAPCYMLGACQEMDRAIDEAVLGKSLCVADGVTVGSVIRHGGSAYVVTRVYGKHNVFYRCFDRSLSVARVSEFGAGMPDAPASLAGIIEQDPKMENHGCAPFNARVGNVYAQENGRKVEIAAILEESPRCTGARPLAVRLAVPPQAFPPVASRKAPPHLAAFVQGSDPATACANEWVYVGLQARHENGSWAKVEQVSGPSSSCANPRRPTSVRLIHGDLQ